MSDIEQAHDYDPGVESGAAAGVTNGDEEIGDGIVGGSTYAADDLTDDDMPDGDMPDDDVPDDERTTPG